MSIKYFKYINIFQSKALQHLPKLGIFLFENKPSGNPGMYILATAKSGFPLPAWKQAKLIGLLH
jgi:hypothetical protein